MTIRVSASTIRRLSHYLRILDALEQDGGGTVSSTHLAREAGTTAAQVRKDLSFFGSFGKRGLGYAVSDLGGQIRAILGLDRAWSVALVGAGRIGAALFEYGALRQRGFRIRAVLDQDPAKTGLQWGEVRIEDVALLESEIERVGADIAIIAVPASAAQEVVDRVVRAGVRGIFNFAPARLRTPAGVSVHDVNLGMELEALTFELTRSAPAAGADGGA